MSRIARNWAFLQIRQHDLTPCAKVVFILLAERHNQETGLCYPSIRRIAEDANISESAVKASIRQLKKAGCLKVIARKSKTGRGKLNMTNLYVFNGGAISAPRMGRYLPPNRETNQTPSAHYDLAMTLEEDSDV